MGKKKRAKTSPSSQEDALIEAAIEKLASEQPSQKIQGAKALARRGGKARSAVPDLVKMLADKNTKVAEAAACALRDIGPPARDAVPTLIGYIDDRRTQFKFYVHAALKYIGPAAFSQLCERLIKNPKKCTQPFRDCFVFMALTCFDELLPLLEHGDADVRRMAYHALGHCSKKNRPRAMELLTQGLEDESKAVRNIAKKQLEQEVFFAREKTLATTLRKAKGKTGAASQPVAKDLLERLSPQDFHAEHAELLRQLNPKQATSRASLSKDILAKLELPRWNRLSLSGKKSVQATITECLNSAGYQLSAEGIERYGPKSDSQAIAVWRSAQNLRFVLVPGGAFHPGFDENRLRSLERVAKQLAGSEFDLNPKRLPVFGDYCCDVTQQRSVSVAPVLMAGELLTKPMLGESTKKRSAKRAKKRIPKREESWPLDFDLHQLVELLRERHWSLPSSEELEWAILGGRESIFHWGNRAGEFVKRERVLAEYDDSRWPYCSRFGLTAPLSYVTWCQPKKGNTPLVTRGGATSFSPWQACGEWMLYLTAVSVRHAIITEFGQRFSAALRPVIRLR